MAEQQKESSPKDFKKKNSLLDDDFGTEFLGSWKPMSMADDDAMDFSFGTVSKSKKKIFDFEKMDMNFDLDTAFGKISSFKVDMSDLDFTCPPKKPSQSTDKKGEASCAKAGKQDGFNFGFDFNELDRFNLDSDLLKVDTNNEDSYPRKKGITAEGNDGEDAKKSKINDDDRGVRSSNDNKITKPRAPEMLETFNTETSVGNLGNLVSRQDLSVSKFSSPENHDTEVKNQTSDISKITSMKNMDQEKDLYEETKSTKSKSEQVINKVPSQSVSQSDSEQDTISEKHTKVSLSGTRVINVAADKQEVNGKATFVDSSVVDLQLEPSSLPLTTESDGIVREAITPGSSAEEVSNDTQPENSYSSPGNMTKVDSLKNSCENSISENKRTALECKLATARSSPIVEKVTLMKDKDLQVNKSNIVSMLENKSSSKNPSSTSGTKSVVSFDSKKNADIHLRSIAQERNSFKSNETKFGSKMLSDSLLGSSKVISDAPAFLGSKGDPKSCNARKGVVFDGTPSAGKLTGNMKSFHEDVNKRKAMFLETGMSTKNVNILSSQVNPSSLTEKTTKLTTQISLNSQPEASGKESFQKSKVTHIEGNKLSSLKSCKITPAFSSVKTSRNIGANSVLATYLHQKEANSLASSEQKKEIQTILASKGDHPTDSGDNQKASARFLKRKSIEISEADLTSSRPLKRLPQSPGRNRNNDSKESSGKVEQAERKHNDLAYYDSTSGLESPSEIKVTEVEIPDSVLMEDNGNVEKAEAYMKELENICNMLKKRHEEAKELLVRAVVNDNNLLMLNHPIYEEKIRKVEKFASQLTSKEIQT